MTLPEASLIARDLTRTVSGWVIEPGDTGWDEARRPFNLRTDQHPAVVVDAAGPADIAAAVRYASRHGVRWRCNASVLDRVEPVRSAACDGAYDGLFAAVNRAAAPSRPRTTAQVSTPKQVMDKSPWTSLSACQITSPTCTAHRSSSGHTAHNNEDSPA